MTDLRTFGLRDMLDCLTALLASGDGATSMEETAQRIVGWLRDNLVDEQGAPALALARLYKTVPLGDLPAPLATIARAGAPGASDAMPCFTLLASAGAKPEWNDRNESHSHRVIPLPDAAAIEALPMVAQLVRELGIEVGQLLTHDTATAEHIDQQPFGVFHVVDAADSEHIPSQDELVGQYGVRSVLGFGGGLPNGSVFAVMMFSTVTISAETAAMFSTIGVSVKVAVLPFIRNRVFAANAQPPDPGPFDAARLGRSQVAALRQLLDVLGGEVKTQSIRLEHALGDVASSEARKSAILEAGLDCVIGMDSTGRITDWNRAAETTFGYPRTDAIGQLLSDLIVPPDQREDHHRALQRYLLTGEGSVVGRRVEVVAQHRGGRLFPTELSVTRVPGSAPAMFSGSARDITERQRYEQEMLASRERLAHIAHTLQQSLLPPGMPMIGGLELGAVYRPAGADFEVGGDFYDVFEIGNGRWAFALGDVCGKGPDAAVITSLARHTLRATAIRNPEPTHVLGTLNDVVHSEHPEQFCTAVYATVDPANGDVALSLGGHPHPLLLRPTGEVEQIGTPGRLLGAFPTWTGQTSRIVMDPGDLLLFYTDGLTEARRGREQYGELRLINTLAGLVGLTVERVVTSLEKDVVGFAGELNDDLAILAIRHTG